MTAHHARSIGWDARLSAALKERDDMHQERDAETHRACLAESRFAILKDKSGTILCIFFNFSVTQWLIKAKLQTEVWRLQKSWKKPESSETILQDARSRIQPFRDSVFWFLLFSIFTL